MTSNSTTKFFFLLLLIFYQNKVQAQQFTFFIYKCGFLKNKTIKESRYSKGIKKTIEDAMSEYKEIKLIDGKETKEIKRMLDKQKMKPKTYKFYYYIKIHISVDNQTDYYHYYFKIVQIETSIYKTFSFKTTDFGNEKGIKLMFKTEFEKYLKKLWISSSPTPQDTTSLIIEELRHGIEAKKLYKQLDSLFLDWDKNRDRLTQLDKKKYAIKIKRKVNKLEPLEEYLDKDKKLIFQIIKKQLNGN